VQEGALRVGGDIAKAVDLLRKAGMAQAEKRSGRSASEGLVDAYIHTGNRVGVLIEVTARRTSWPAPDEFAKLVRDLALQACAAGAEYVRREEVPAARIDKEREIFRAQLESSGKPAAILDKIVEGKLAKFYSEVCLLEQPFVKDDKLTVQTWFSRPPPGPARTSSSAASSGSTSARSSGLPAAYQRILLKLSGEILAGKAGHGIDENVMADLADEIRQVHDMGVQIGIVTGGGNIFRAWPPAPGAWTVSAPTTWACSPR